MGRKEIERHKTNPFRDEVIKQTLTGTRTIYGSPTQTDAFAVKSADGRDVHIAFGKRVKVDKSQFLKLYADGVKMFLGLGSAGVKVFMLIYDLMMDDGAYNKDSVILQYDLLEDNVKDKISRATFFRGINELKKAKFLASSTVEAVYWINASYVLRGDRLTLVKQYELDKKAEIAARHEINVTPTIEEGGVADGDTGTDTSGADG